MSPNIVKCASCNIVINELLSFVQNKIDVMDEESLVRICSTSFSDVDIENAKSLLCDSLAKRKKVRRGEGGARRSLHDIISLIKETDPEETPIFVAKELQKLPPVTFDHVDVTRLLKDIIVIQKELRSIQDNYTSQTQYVTLEQFEEIKKEIEDLKRSKPQFQYSEPYVNMRRGANCLQDSLECYSGPMGLSPWENSKNNDVFLNINKTADDCKNSESDHGQGQCNTGGTTGTNEIRCNESRSHSPVNKIISPSLSVSVQQSAVPTLSSLHDQITMPLSPLKTSQAKADYIMPDKAQQPTLANQIEKPLLSTPQYQQRKQVEKPVTMAEIVQDGEWKVVERRKSQRNIANKLEGKMGKALSTSDGFRAAESKVPILITNVHKQTKESDIVNYIASKTNERVTLKQIEIRDKRKDHNAYKLFVSKFKVGLFLDETMWPEGIVFRRFVQFPPGQRRTLDGGERSPISANG